jgi:phospholipid-binding lipoprotein MlaA
VGRWSARSYGTFVSFVVAGLLAGGCATVSTSMEPVRSSALLEVEPAPVNAVEDGADDATVDTLVIAQATRTEGPDQSPSDTDDEYDPWEPFNEKMFDFNYKVDRYVLKPVARGYRTVMPEQFQIMIDNGFYNIKVVPRVVNNLLQGKFEGALHEVSRFVVNSTLGVGGLFDAAKYAGLERHNEDFGQTLGLWGTPAGPYLVLPFLEPMTVRDGIGRAVDGAMDPLSYVLPFFWDRLGMRLGEVVNDRALNYDLFQGVEETTLDLYSSVRHFYLKRREQQIRE